MKNKKEDGMQQMDDAKRTFLSGENFMRNTYLALTERKMAMFSEYGHQTHSPFF